MIILDMDVKPRDPSSRPPPYVGLLLDGHGVVRIPPPAAYRMWGWSRERILAYAMKKGWKVIEIEDKP